MAEDIIYPLINKSKETVLEYNPEHFITESGYFFSPNFRTSDIIIENILKGYEKTGGQSLKDFFEGKLIFRHCFMKDKNLNENLSANINQINNNMGSNLKINNVVAVCKDKEMDSVFFATSNELYASIRNKDNRQKEYYIISLSDIFVKNDAIDYVSGEPLISNIQVTSDFVDFARVLKVLDTEIDVTGCYHPMIKRPMMQRRTYINTLIDRCILDGYLTVNEISRIEMLSRLLGISSPDVLKITSDSVKGMKKDNKYIIKSVKKVKKLEKFDRYMLLHDLVVMDYLCKERRSLENIPRYTRTYVKHYKFPSVNLLEYRRAIRNFIERSGELKDILFQGQMLTGDRQMCEILFKSVQFKYSMPEPLKL